MLKYQGTSTSVLIPESETVARSDVQRCAFSNLSCGSVLVDSRGRAPGHMLPQTMRVILHFKTGGEAGTGRKSVFVRVHCKFMTLVRTPPKNNFLDPLLICVFLFISERNFKQTVVQQVQSWITYHDEHGVRKV